MGSCLRLNQFQLPISLITGTRRWGTSLGIISGTHQQIEIGTVLVRENNTNPVIVIIMTNKKSSLKTTQRTSLFFLLIVNILMIFEGPHSNTFIYIESEIILTQLNLFYLPDIQLQLNCPLLLQFQEHYLSNIKKTMIFIVIA